MALFLSIGINCRKYKIHNIWTAYILGYRLRNFEIRVGNDTEMAKNGLSYKQLESVGDGLTISFPCHEALCGTWVSVSKSDSAVLNAYLQLCEVRAFGSKYSWKDKKWNTIWHAVVRCGMLYKLYVIISCDDTTITRINITIPYDSTQSCLDTILNYNVFCDEINRFIIPLL